MTYECESEYSTSYYRCIDPIENLKIKVILKPIKNPYIPLPQFDIDHGAEGIPFSDEDNQQQEVEEYTFQWQEKIFSRSEFKKIKNSASSKKSNGKHWNNAVTDTNNQAMYPEKLFSYIDLDNYNPIQIDGKNKLPKRKINILNSSSDSQYQRNLGNIPKAKIINYCPTKEVVVDKNINSRHIQKMFIMIDLDSNGDKEKEGNHEVLCLLQYNTSNKLLEVTPSFSISELKPYIIGGNLEGSRNSYYYWLIHASTGISTNCLRKEIGIMTKVLNHQEEMKNLLIGTEFNMGQKNCVYVTLLADVISAQDFEYDHLYIKYYVKLPTGWECNDKNSLSGLTQTCSQNSKGIAHFSHLFEINFFTELQLLEGGEMSTPEIIFEVISVDKYRRYRNEGYSYLHIPIHPGMYEYDLRCWRAVSKKIWSQLERFFIGGGPELEDITYVGLSNAPKTELLSRFGFETIPSGKIRFKMSLLHQSETFKRKEAEQFITEKNIQDKSDADALLSSINTVLESFRRARDRMLEAKKGIEPQLNSLSTESQNGATRRVVRLKDR